MTDLAALHRSELEALVVDLAKTGERYRQSLANMVPDFEDEGDRVYFGSTNDADELREIEASLAGTGNYLECRWMHGRDLYADLNELRNALATMHAREAELVGDAYWLGQYDALTGIAQHLEQAPPEAVGNVENRQDEIKGMNDATRLIIAQIVHQSSVAFGKRTVARQFDPVAEDVIRTTAIKATDNG